MIHPRTADVFNFLWNHLEKDMNSLGQALDQNMDNTAVVVHLIINNCTEFTGDFPTTFIMLLLLFV